MSDQTRVVTFQDAVADLGWFSWLFALVVGGPSCLALLQAVFVEHQLLTALGWIVDGYNRVLLVIEGALGPLLEPLIRALGEWLNISLLLQPHWKQLFVLGMIFVASYARTAWRGRQHLSAVLVGSGLTILALTCATAASLAPLSSWLAHGWVAFSMAVLLTVVLAVAVKTTRQFYFRFSPRDKDGVRRGPAGVQHFSKTKYSLNPLALAIPLSAFALGALGALAPQLQTSAGIIAFNLVLLSTGIGAVVMGVRRANLSSTRLGLTILGGFLAAMVIVVADRVIGLVHVT